MPEDQIMPVVLPVVQSPGRGKAASKRMGERLTGERVFV